ncbi:MULTISPECIES: flagellin N-terminal helical domain-containing protein [unclassified Butyrivibrio]|uniref:flagellin N-terminal helical domain-containing protein n=1 Tax=unclassified Butyrivibrio TaxID=2639466 RepID=UPI00040E7BBA|nr:MULTISPECIES: flagellin [unclassified Butyrivibrio]SEL65959.1 flagellin [Butyrivibrio sp. ob235]
MQVNYNISAMIANNALVANDNKLAESIERLSSGLKIANAKDNPSGLAISRRMNAQIKSLGVAGGNSGDGVSVIQTADGTLHEVHDILQRMSVLAVQAANGTNSQTDLDIIQDEIVQLKDEITRISEATQFNGQTLLDGTFDFRGYTTVDDDTDPDITINSYSDLIDGGNYYIEGLYCDYDEKTGKVTLLDEDGYKAESVKIDVTRITLSQGRDKEITYMSEANVTVDGDLIKIATRDGREIEIKANKKLEGERIDMELTRKGAMTMQIGANEGQTLDIRIPKITLSNLGIEYADVSRTFKDDLIDAVDYLDADDYMSYSEKQRIIDMTYYDSTKQAIDETKGIEDGSSYYFINRDDARKISEEYRKTQDAIKDYYDAEAEQIQKIQDKAAADIAANPANQAAIEAQRDLDIAITQANYDDLRTRAQNDYETKVEDIMKAGDERGRNAPHTGADQLIEDIGNAIQKVSDIRSRLGAYQNRLDHTISNINVTSENMTAAYSRIMDVDMAEEMTVYSTQQVLSQAGTSMLAQANERPQQVLQLLQ